MLAAISGGRIDLHGVPVAKRWTRLAAAAAANSSELLLAGANLGWRAGQRVLVTSTTFNPQQAEVRLVTVAAEQVDGTTRLTLDAPLSYNHTAKLKTYKGEASHSSSSATTAIAVLHCCTAHYCSLAVQP